MSSENQESAAPVALVTGAARGIGAEIARAFAKRGYRLVLVDCETDALHDVVTELEAAGAEVAACDGDLCDLDFAKSTVDAGIERFGRLDALVNNAAWREVVTMRTISLESWERTLRVSLTTPAFLARWAAESMARQGRGVIIQISSIMAGVGAGTSPAYAAAKGGLNALTFELANLYGPQGIRVLAVQPGAIDTTMSQDIRNADGVDVVADLRAESEAQIPLGRWGEGGEIANLVAWLASDEASYLTGTAITADGGWSRHLTSYAQNRALFPEEST